MAICSSRVRLVESLLPAGLLDSGIAARVDDAWLQLTARPVRELVTTTGGLWPLLGRNAELEGSIRLALAPGSHVPHLRADLPIEDGAEEGIERRVASLCHTFMRYVASEKTSPPPRFGVEFGADASLDPTRVAGLCLETGWSCATRATGDITVTLAAGAVAYSARLEPGGKDAVSFVVDLFDASAYSSDSRAAVALVLLSASSAVRSVKAIVRPDGGGETGALAASCAAPASANALDLALSSLTVACELVGREAQALADLDLARDCLTWWGCDHTALTVIADAREGARRDIGAAAQLEPAPSFG